MRQDRMSFCIPVYENTKYLQETIGSIVDSQDKNYPIYVVDDSRKSTEAKNIAKIFGNRVIYFKNSEHLGASNNFNQSTLVANSKYLMIVGPDDKLIMNVNLLLDKYENIDFSALQPGVESIDEHGNNISNMVDKFKLLLMLRKGVGKLDNQALINSLAFGNWTYNPSIIWNLDFLKTFKYDLKYKIAMDLDLLMRLALSDRTFVCDNLKIFQYRRHLDSVSMKANGYLQLREVLEIHSFVLSQREKIELKTKILLALAPLARTQAVLAFNREEMKIDLLKILFRRNVV